MANGWPTSRWSCRGAVPRSGLKPLLFCGLHMTCRSLERAPRSSAGDPLGRPELQLNQLWRYAALFLAVHTRPRLADHAHFDLYTISRRDGLDTICGMPCLASCIGALGTTKKRDAILNGRSLRRLRMRSGSCFGVGMIHNADNKEVVNQLRSPSLFSFGRPPGSPIARSRIGEDAQ